jgi:hypothetical protein
MKTKFNIGQEVFIGVQGARKVWSGKVHMTRVETSPYGTTTNYDIIVDDKEVSDNYFKDINECAVFATYEDAKKNWLGDKTEDEVKREHARARLNNMSLEDCIKMWNEEGADMYNRSAEIHEVDEEKWWDYLSEELGAYYLATNLLSSRADGHFTHYDRFFFYDENDCTFHSFDDKKGLVKVLGEWFIEEFINR